MNIEKILSLTEDINLFIKILRKQNNIPSKTLAEKLNKGAAYISQIENYRIKNIDEGTVRIILKELNLSDTDIQTVIDHFNEKKVLGETRIPKDNTVNNFTSQVISKKVYEQIRDDYKKPEANETIGYFNEGMELVVTKMTKMLQFDPEVAKQTLDEIILIVDENLSKSYQERILKMMDDPEFREQMLSVMADTFGVS
ncbi:helix-turn-helix transcriptional regulator [Bacillus amyloliquefaciens]|uniref:Helix-turn-helix transcriptional regulator n=1 Tax=Bacillus subtilis TaxID=1423 RepID=A0A8I2B7N6_BACIU|nr:MULTISPECIES: helix-turn-helix transcriptional regulator [Bacillus subtilis group]MBO3797142.1 helix-turn-helix transcriptional regulator [Bacillus subtilis]MCV4327031.1 helix-turn-helix domain-containing protein [Bacillus velezensis]NUI61447.1 helix-turn-helix transcriptional regulator [Bacillus amyloliquefaciens]